ncbi:MAG: phage tail tape measure protein, partial [Planctomycetes bacterium]|nr:phage tail tape measure protein [Planctomycetota bacterium]
MSIGLAAPIIGAGVALFRTGANFEKAMNRVRALSGATGEDLKALREQALLLGRTTVHSASEAATAQGLLAQAGFNTQEMLSTLPGVLNLASAGQIELASAANISANVLRGYNLEATQSGMVADVLAKAQASANVTIEELGEAFKMAGPLASAAGLDFNETAAALALVA